MRGVLVILVLGLSGFLLLFFVFPFFLFCYTTQSWKKRSSFVLFVDTMGLVGVCIMVMVLGVL